MEPISTDSSSLSQSVFDCPDGFGHGRLLVSTTCKIGGGSKNKEKASLIFSATAGGGPSDSARYTPTPLIALVQNTDASAPTNWEDDRRYSEALSNAVETAALDLEEQYQNGVMDATKSDRESGRCTKDYIGYMARMASVHLAKHFVIRTAAEGDFNKIREAKEGTLLEPQTYPEYLVEGAEVDDGEDDFEPLDIYSTPSQPPPLAYHYEGNAGDGRRP